MANAAEKAPGRGGGRRILVIEDEFQLRRLVARLFTLEGFAHATAGHADRRSGIAPAVRTALGKLNQAFESAGADCIARSNDLQRVMGVR